MERERGNLLPRLSPVATAKQRARVGSGVDHTGLAGVARLDVPEALDGLIGKIAQLQTLFRQVPGLASIHAHVQMRAEPSAQRGGVGALGVAWVHNNVVDLLAGQ